MDVGVISASWGLALVDSCPAEKDGHHGEIFLLMHSIEHCINKSYLFPSSLMLVQSPFPSSSSHALSSSLISPHIFFFFSSFSSISHIHCSLVSTRLHIGLLFTVCWAGGVGRFRSTSSTPSRVAALVCG